MDRDRWKNVINVSVAPADLWVKGLSIEDIKRLRFRMRYAPFALRMWVSEWNIYVLPIRAISLN